MGIVSHGKALCEVDWVVVQEVLDLDNPRVHNHTNRKHLDLWPGTKIRHYGYRSNKNNSTSSMLTRGDCAQYSAHMESPHTKECLRGGKALIVVSWKVVRKKNG